MENTEAEPTIQDQNESLRDTSLREKSSLSNSVKHEPEDTLIQADSSSANQPQNESVLHKSHQASKANLDKSVRSHKSLKSNSSQGVKSVGSPESSRLEEQPEEVSRRSQTVQVPINHIVVQQLDASAKSIVAPVSWDRPAETPIQTLTYQKREPYQHYYYNRGGLEPGWASQKRCGCPLWLWLAIAFIALTGISTTFLVLLIKKRGGQSVPASQLVLDWAETVRAVEPMVICEEGFFAYEGKCIKCPEPSTWNGTKCVVNVLLRENTTTVSRGPIVPEAATPATQLTQDKSPWVTGNSGPVTITVPTANTTEVKEIPKLGLPQRLDQKVLAIPPQAVKHRHLARR